VYILSNTIIGNGLQYCGIGIEENLFDCEVCGNIITGVYSGIRTYWGQQSLPMKNVNVSHNIIYNLHSTDPADPARGIDIGLYSGSYNVRFTHNIIKDADIGIQTSRNNVSDSTLIESNNISDISNWAIGIRNQATIKDNYIENADSGIFFYDGYYIIEGNYIKDCISYSITSAGDVLYPNSIIRNNLIENINQTDTEIRLSAAVGTDNIMVLNNIIRCNSSTGIFFGYFINNYCCIGNIIEGAVTAIDDGYTIGKCKQIKDNIGFKTRNKGVAEVAEGDSIYPGIVSVAPSLDYISLTTVYAHIVTFKTWDGNALVVDLHTLHGAPITTPIKVCWEVISHVEFYNL
jgi:hypothetical protein